MGKNLDEIAEQLKGAKNTINARSAKESEVIIQLIYAFNGTGKTRLSKVFKELIEPKNEIEDIGLENRKIIYYNAFTEDLFYWDNDLENDLNPKLKIHPNSFTKWIFEEQGCDVKVIENFQRYTDERLMPKFNAKYTSNIPENKTVTVDAFTEITFSYQRGNSEILNNIKISKGEESCFIWSVFYSFLGEIINVLNTSDESDRETNEFDDLEYVFIDDPVTSLDDNHLIELAVDLATLLKLSKSGLKFIITTHNPLFYNVLYNEFKKRIYKKYLFQKTDEEGYELIDQNNDSPFSYHLYLLSELENAVEKRQVKKYHFNFLRNILEKTATFLGYDNWGELLKKIDDDSAKLYESRIINISSHSKYSGDEVAELSDDNKRVLEYLLKKIKEIYNFK